MSNETHASALDLLRDEMARWSAPEVDTAYRLQSEAERPVIELPLAPEIDQANVTTLISRLRRRPHPVVPAVYGHETLRAA